MTEPNPTPSAPLTALLTRIQGDPSLLEALRVQSDPQAIAQQIQQIGSAQGVFVTQHEVLDLLRGQRSSELSDDSLEAVAGGQPYENTQGFTCRGWDFLSLYGCSA